MRAVPIFQNGKDILYTPPARPTIQPQYIDPADIVQIDGRLYLRGIDGRLTPLDSWLVVEAFRHWKETAERLENPPEKL